MPVGPTPPVAPLPPPPPPSPVQMPGLVTAPVASSPFAPDAWRPSMPQGAPSAPAPVAPAGGLAALKAKGQALLVSIADAIFPLKAAQQPGVQAIQYSPIEKVKQIGRSAIFFGLPVGGAALVACGLGWVVGPFVPFVGGHVIGAAAATLLVGHTAGSLLHGAMRLPLVTRPEDRELNSAGATLGSAGLGAAFAWGIAAAAGATITPWIILGGAALGAAPRLMEWMGGKALS